MARQKRLSIYLSVSAVLVTAFTGVSAAADTLSNNLSSASGGTEAASGGDLLAASFTTDSATDSLGSVTLPLADLTSSGGTAVVSLYSDGGLEPGILIATLTGASSYTTTLADVTLSASGISLSADSTYWVVLSASTGEIDWSFAADDNGTGSGFADEWAASYDDGSTWYTYTSAQGEGVDPLQMDVESTSASTAPEAGGASLALLGGLALGTVGLLRRNRKSPLREKETLAC